METFAAMSFFALFGNYLKNHTKKDIGAGPKLNVFKNEGEVQSAPQTQIQVARQGPQQPQAPHNNTTPFFGSAVTQNVDPMRGTQSLELFTGTRPDYRNKTEVENMFAPQRDLTNIHGAPAVAAQTQDRFIPSTEKRYIKPSEQIRVGPGMNVGTDVVSSGGFHDMTRFKPTLVDAYRLNQLPGNINVGTARIMNRGEVKHMDIDQRNEDFVAGREPVASASAVRQQSVRENFQFNKFKNINAPPIGGATGTAQGGVNHGSREAFSNANMNSDREWCNDPTRGAMGAASMGSGQMVTSGYTTHTTDRELTGGDYNNRMRNMGSVQRGNQVQFSDYDSTMTMREQMPGLDPSNPNGGRAKAMSYQQNDLGHTMREQTGQNDAGQVRGAHTQLQMNSNPTNGMQMNITQRETTSSSYGGGAGSVNSKPMSYDDILNSEGYSLRAATDENRMPATLKLNEDPTRGREMTNVELRPGAAASHRANMSQRQNEFHDVSNIPAYENDPNRIEVLNDRVETMASDVPDQLRNNPYVISRA